LDGVILSERGEWDLNPRVIVGSLTSKMAIPQVD